MEISLQLKRKFAIFSHAAAAVADAAVFDIFYGGG
jgi:hypothetical protein